MWTLSIFVGVVSDCLNNYGFLGWPDMPGVAWRRGVIMSNAMDHMATNVDQQELAPHLLASASRA